MAPTYFTGTSEYFGERLAFDSFKNLFEFRRQDRTIGALSYPWHLAGTLSRRETDILILNSKLGALFVEIKGIYLNQIESISYEGWHTKDKFYTDFIHPVRQLEETTQNFRLHCDKHNLHAVPIKGIICLPYITSEDWHAAGFSLYAFLPPIVFKDDLENQDKLFEKLKAIPNIGFKQSLDGVTFDDVKTLLFGSIDFDKNPHFDYIPDYDEAITHYYNGLKLTDKQAKIVDYTGEALVINGVAGSGKTLCMAASAKRKLDEGARVLFICYNKLLAQTIRNLLYKNEMDPNTTSLYVRNFHQWSYYQIKHNTPCAVENISTTSYYTKKMIATLQAKLATHTDNRFLDQELYTDFLLEECHYLTTLQLKTEEDYQNLTRKGRGNLPKIRKNSQDRSIIFSIYDDYVAEKARQNKMEFIDHAPYLLEQIDRLPRYDYIYVDEAQDLNLAELQLLRQLTTKGFYLASDRGQKLYNTFYTYKDIGLTVNASNSIRLNESYRSTYQIFKFASALQQNDITLKSEDYTEPYFNTLYQGPFPTLYRFEDNATQHRLMTKKIKNYLANSPGKSIGILVKTKKQLEIVSDYLKVEGIKHHSLNQKVEVVQSKNTYVHLLTMHTSKGLEFDYVQIYDFSSDPKLAEKTDENFDYWNQQRKLFYVAFTRSRHLLDIFYLTQANQLVYELPAECYDVVGE